MPKVSVVVPIYNAERTLERCAVHLFEQTIDDIEYIFIDDCSTDSSVELLNRTLSNYPSRLSQSHIHVMGHNSGVAAVRALGISMATGDYVIHCDSDDWPEKEMYASMYDMANSTSADIVISGFYFEVNSMCYDWTLDYCKSDPLKYLLNNQMTPALWNKLIKRSLYSSSFIYPVDDMCEDFLFTTQLLLNAQKVAFLNKSYYHFYYNPHSMTHGSSMEKIVERHNQTVSNIGKSINLIKRWDINHKYGHDIVRQCFLVKNGLSRYVHFPEIYKLWKDTFREVNGKVVFCRSISVKEKGIYILTYFKVYNLYRKLKYRRK